MLAKIVTTDLAQVAKRYSYRVIPHAFDDTVDASHSVRMVSIMTLDASQDLTLPDRTDSERCPTGLIPSGATGLIPIPSGAGLIPSGA